MLISSRGRYALRVLTDLAEHSGEGYIPLKEIAERQGISQKYMESIMTMLSKNDLLDGAHGKGGGYRLNRPAEEYRVSEILEITEGSLAPVCCLECGAEVCPRTEICRTLPMWKKLDSLIQGYLSSVTLADLMNGTADSPETKNFFRNQ